MPRSCQGARVGVELGLVVNRVQHDLAAAAGLAPERPAVYVRSFGPVFSSRNLKAKDAGPKGQIPLAEVAARGSYCRWKLFRSIGQQINAVLPR